jgi:hypothetical protein
MRYYLCVTNDSFYKYTKHNYNESQSFNPFVERFVLFHEKVPNLDFLETLYEEVNNQATQKDLLMQQTVSNLMLEKLSEA